MAKPDGPFAVTTRQIEAGILTPPEPLHSDHEEHRMSDLQQTFHVIGMTCGHCAPAIEEEVGALDKAGYELVS